MEDGEVDAGGVEQREEVNVEAGEEWKVVADIEVEERESKRY